MTGQNKSSDENYLEFVKRYLGFESQIKLIEFKN